MTEFVGSDGVNWDLHWREVQKEYPDANIQDLEWAINYLPRHKFDILELGCGPARFCNVWTDLGGQYYGIDMSSVAIGIARKLHPNNELVLGMNSAINIFGMTFDVIFTCAHLQHVSNSLKDEIFTRAHGYLNNRGLFIMLAEKHDLDSETTMSFPVLEEFMTKHGFYLEKYVGDPTNGFVWRKV